MLGVAVDRDHLSLVQPVQCTPHDDPRFYLMLMHRVFFRYSFQSLGASSADRQFVVVCCDDVVVCSGDGNRSVSGSYDAGR